MIAPDNLPPGTAMTQVVTQLHLDECSRGLGRPLYDYEVRILDDMLTAQSRANLTLMKRGKATSTHSMDEIVHIFVERISHFEKGKDAEKLAVMKRVQEVADQ